MFRKALPRALPRSSRAFHPWPSVAKLVATKPAKTEEVKVGKPLQPMTRFSPFQQCWSSGKYPLIEHEFDAVVVFVLNLLPESYQL